MAEDDAKFGKAKFKSKWGRVFKEKEEPEQGPKHTSSFKLDEDITAFLKPSTDKAASTRPNLAAPKLDIAVAQRWPDANEVRKASAGTPPVVSAAATPNGFTKPKRRKGLRVGFVKTEPEIMGEGGDESEEPPSEVSRQKAMMTRSFSERKPVAMSPPRKQARPSNEDTDDFRPKALQRAGTSYNELSPPVQRKTVSPPSLDEPTPRQMLNRTPTGLGSQADHLAHDPHDPDYEESPIPKITTQFSWEQTGTKDGSADTTSQKKDMSPASPRDADVWAARKRELRSGEGMILRRASAMIKDADVSEEHKRQSLGFGMQPSQQQYDTLSRPDAPQLLPEPRSAVSPRSALSPSGPSPFDDPKYIRRRSREATPAEQQPQQSESVRQRRPGYEPSYMRAVQQQPAPQQAPSARPAIAQVQAPRSSVENERRPGHEPSYMRAAQQPTTRQAPPARPPIPQVQAPRSSSENEEPSGRTAQPGRTGLRKPQNGNHMPNFPSPETARSMRPPADPPRSRDPSPLPDRTVGNNAAAVSQRSFYARTNGSSGSFGSTPSSPRYAHSRGSSLDGDSPQQFSTPGLVSHQSVPSPRIQMYDQSPHSSPRSSTFARSPLSHHSRETSPNGPDYFPAQKASHGQSLRPSAGYLGIDDPSSRPGSSSSSQSFQRPAINFSAPRPHQSQPPPPSPAGSSRENVGRPPASTNTLYQQRPTDYLTANKTASSVSIGRTAAANLREEDARRSNSSGLSPPEQRPPMISPHPTSEGNPAADVAYADFSSRVAHMKGVFRLTAEKERPSDRCTPQAWLRAALWWYLRGKAGLEVLLQQPRPRSSDGPPRELLTQPHVDLAKTWWILSDPLDELNSSEATSPQSPSSAGGYLEASARHSITMLRSHIKSLSLSMTRNQLMPPPASLIQGRDTTIWLEYPRFTANAAAVLGGTASKSVIADTSRQAMQPLEALPLGDTQEAFCYGRFQVEVSMSTDEAETDRIVLPCMLTMARGKRDFLSTIVVASQSELVNIRVAPRPGGERGLTWHDVSWKASSHGLIIRLPHGYDMMIRMQERDFRSLWNLVEYSRKVEHSLRTEQNEKLVNETHLAEVQYADSSNANAFPSEKLRGALAVVFERTIPVSSGGGGERKAHRGYRLLLVTDPKHKSLASASHEVLGNGPLLYEFITDSAANGMAAMVVRIREEKRQCRMLLVFPDAGARQSFYDVLNGLSVAPDETIMARLNLSSMNIEPTTQAEGFAQSGHPALQALQWQKLGITNGALEEDLQSRVPRTVESERLRLVARHATGCVTDRLNLGKGELLLRIPCVDTPAIQMLRNPQEDMGMSVDTRQSLANVVDGISELMQTVRQQATIRTLTFSSFDDLHAFQTAITGCTVRYDAMATSLSISRRRMVVPIYKKWEASNVRIQLVAQSTVVQVLAFMEDFSHADALCFQIKSTDVFETVKGDGKGKKWAVRMVDAKFSLPHHEKGEVSAEERVRRRFVNLEGLDYAEEHDDITVGFDTEADRDRFAQALPTAATRARGLTLKRRT
ncbi:hypothetical protein LTR37_000126 [Vermiconidia calcicola]|uniref:Uncharacterized protein n=1 Tax=Vermiconidia calcicola TaxID=1690605 RepID=A0ACC3NZF8_9PEZI|nr:hypothetical protein LTR37_000126 [Vermiconidia calcicola]